MSNRAEGQSHWDQVAPEYDRLYSGGWSRREDEQLALWLREISLNRPRILDIGCGTGLGYRLLKIALPNLSYTGVDISAGMLEQFHAWLNSSDDQQRVKLYNLPAECVSEHFAGQTFDLVILTNTAGSYVRTPTILLKNCRDLLAPSGALFASFLNRNSLRRSLSRLVGPIELFRTRGATAQNSAVRAITVSESELRRRCERVGFRVEWIRYQSVLGGVVENDLAIGAERFMSRLLPQMGHSINVYAVR